jgi:hypothetical protein
MEKRAKYAKRSFTVKLGKIWHLHTLYHTRARQTNSMHDGISAPVSTTISNGFSSFFHFNLHTRTTRVLLAQQLSAVAFVLDKIDLNLL